LSAVDQDIRVGTYTPVECINYRYRRTDDLSYYLYDVNKTNHLPVKKELKVVTSRPSSSAS
jgi:hypothetical protein